VGIDAGAQTPNAGGQDLLHGSIFTAQGQPAPEATVELRDLRGIKVASAITNGSGNFEINSAAAPVSMFFWSAADIRSGTNKFCWPSLVLN